ncbi:hypothetical protein C7974DRAFT_377502 [Boeremia exigua]|uniref:uncharacterized protein n=1 Tax=Boeremia exigua TaxID=749465 RepID=UPI001E8CC688|nr:uncharacterized protein C7974DRAFT_377502 [Boeremia exigua]KAH6621842.1 hypothetical protein C7974DRAFT_377502 [Boeremia exigua]
MSTYDPRYQPLFNPINSHIGAGHTQELEDVELEKLYKQTTSTSALPHRWFDVQKYCHKPKSWQLGLFVGLGVSIVVLISNVVILLFGAVTDGGFVDGIGTIAKGHADHIVRLGTAYHVLINICSTVLLTSSNYAMQLLCAPTRAELDQAHQNGRWLEVGLMSFRNLRYIDRKRTLLWVVLAISSAPLHLLYNSSVFHVVAGQDYTITVVSDDARDISSGTGWKDVGGSDWPQLYESKFNAGYGDLILLVDSISMGVQFYPDWDFALGMPDLSSCNWNQVDFTSEGFQSGFSTNRTFGVNATGKVLQPESWQANERAVIALSVLPALSTQYPTLINASRNHTNAKDEFLVEVPFLGSSTSTKKDDVHTIKLPYSVPMNLSSNGTLAQAFGVCSNSGWLRSPSNLPLHVHSARAKQLLYGSKVQLALPFLCIVIVANIAKIVGILLTLRTCSAGPIVTIGDAVASFLERPETSSKGQCVLVTPSLFEKDFVEPPNELGGQVWRSRRLPIMSLLGGTPLWSVPIITLSVSVTLYSLTAATSNGQRVAFWGTSSSAIISLTSTTFDARGALQTALLANLPQVCLSLVYFVINSICTSMCSAREWNEYATIQRGLRVTNPTAAQRSTHFLQLPYRWAIPLTVTSGVLHWLLSQSLFLIRRERRRQDGTLYPESTCACGYSTSSILVFACVFLSLLLVVLSLSIQHLKLRIPPARHRSTIISAACHPPSDDVNCHLKKIQWGVVVEGGMEVVGHCSFSSKEVTAPIEDRLYA